MFWNSLTNEKCSGRIFRPEFFAAKVWQKPFEKIDLPPIRCYNISTIEKGGNFCAKQTRLYD